MGIFDKLFNKKSDSNLPPEIRNVFDKMLGNKPMGGNFPCGMCGGPRGPKDGLFCGECTNFVKINSGFVYARCGGCGAGFMVARGLSPILIKPDGIELAICACCSDHIKKRYPGSTTIPIPRGYDDEGQQLNIKFSDQPLLVKLKARTNQPRIFKLVESGEKVKGLKVTEPIFKADLEEETSNNLMTFEDIHAFGVEIVLNYLKKDGFNVREVNPKPGDFPQVVASKDGALSFIFVKTDIYPNKGILTKREKELFLEFSETQKAISYFAGVGIANAKATNSEEAKIMVKGAGFQVSFSGLEIISNSTS